MNIIERDIGIFSLEYLHESVVRIESPDIYAFRIDKALNEAKKRDLSHLIIYGDREHFANIHYFTGYDPRFEESILILSENRCPILLVGNEGFNYANIIPYKLDKILFQTLSLPEQPRSKNNVKVLFEAFSSAGISISSRVGVIGFKYYTQHDFSDPFHTYDVPYYLISILSQITSLANLSNATDIMIHPLYGLRTTVDIDEIAILELSGTKSSRAVYNVLINLKPGLSEIEASSYFLIDGDPLVSHANLNFTLEGFRLGLMSPGKAILRLGDVCNIGFGYRSSMVARTALYARGKEDLTPEWDNVLESICIPYFKIIAIWYESLKIGTTGKAIIDKIKSQVEEYDSLGIGLNLGHLIHNDEWTTSIFTENAEYPVRSGMAIQCDIISVPLVLPGAHAEDGLIMADKSLRESFAKKYSENWNRIQKRRNFMINNLGIQISDDLLPLSDIQACFFPWMADMSRVLAIS